MTYPRRLVVYRELWIHGSTAATGLAIFTAISTAIFELPPPPSQSLDLTQSYE